VGLVALVLSTQFVPSACAGAGAPLWLPAAPSTRKWRSKLSTRSATCWPEPSARRRGRGPSHLL